MEPLKKAKNFKGPQGPVVLVILDGVGIGTCVEGDVVSQANTPTLDWLAQNALTAKLKAHGTAVGKVLPQLQGKLDGLAMRVPVPDGSIVDLACRLGKKASRKDINAAVQEAAGGPMQRVVEYSEAPLVSSDIIGNTHSSIFDALSTSSQEDGYARIVSWYDNEWGYSNRVVDLIGMLAAVS
jgi:glyceraldehyde 3-phosphate dehydrogenase